MGYRKENIANNIAHFCTWPDGKFGKADVHRIRTNGSTSPGISDGLVIRLSDKTQANRYKFFFCKNIIKAEYVIKKTKALQYCARVKY